MQCDLLVLAPHPDDAELHCGACIAHHVAAGAAVVVVDATAGELGSRGTPEERAREAQAAAEVLGLQARDNLGLPDGHLKADDDAMRAAVVSAIRRYRPGLILAMHPHARHPDHVALGHLARAAHKLAALHNYPAAGETFRGARLLEYEAELPITQPQVLVPCSQTDWDRKRAALACHASQFGLDSAAGPDTAIAQPAFLSWIDHRGASWGYHAGSPFAEALIAPEPLAINDLRAI